MPNLYIGIDPGLSGAVALLDALGAISVHDTPTVEVKKGKGSKREYVIASMAQLLATPQPFHRFVVLEAVHAMPGQGVTSMFSMGRGLGIWEGILSALSIPYVKVAPQTWKKVMLADMPHDTKDSSIIAATRLFPEVANMLLRKKDHGRAEALLMAEYGKRLHGTRG